MATPEELAEIYTPPFGALHLEATASYLSGILPTDTLGSGPELAEDSRQVVSTLEQALYSIRDVETAGHNAAYHLSKLQIFAQTPEALEQLDPGLRKQVEIAIRLLAPQE